MNIHRIVWLYLVLAGLWILVSDRAIALLFVDPVQLNFIRTIKGWLFVSVTSILLYFLLRRARSGMERERQSAEASQAEQSSTLRLINALTDRSTDAIFVKDALGHYLLFNPAAARFVGKSAAEVIGRDDYALFPPEQAVAIMENDRQVMADGQVHTFNEELDTAVGKVVFLATKGALHDESGSVIGMFGISRDITEQKRAEQAVSESETRFRVLFDSAAVSIMTHDPETGMVLQANRRALETYGCETIEEWMQNLVWLEAPYAMADALRWIHQAANEGPQHFKWQSINRFGHLFWEDVRLNAVTVKGVKSVLAISIDITERVQAELELRTRNEELERFNRAMVGRELDMLALKRQVNELSCQLGQQPPYTIAELVALATQTLGGK